ncbi:TetR/AcrR family transcriptional regulator [Granulicella sp. S156]|uniref:TetR/AcrR family transcriptional regulator n=1 Tax=Granulicella sp. S156 TaxID=1747224 RepID=UPI00131B0CAE|nr:TetR family transcriptional regulator C-terminal domain-containing protein [Granulicella sp. S156]
MTTYQPVGFTTAVPLETQKRDAHATRVRFLQAGFMEFYTNSFQGGSISHIVEQSGSTKGALFHHFAGKQQLGYAVVDEIIGPLLLQRWLSRLANTNDPIEVLVATFRKYVQEDITTGHFVNGCPLNNLAQEMSPLDPGFHQRIDGLYASWRTGIAEALARGIATGTVRSDVQPQSVAALIVAAQMGIWGTGKSSQNATQMRTAAEGLYTYLESLRSIKPSNEEAR